MVQRADSLAGVRSSITRNDELLLSADGGVDEDAIAAELADAARGVLGFQVRVRAKKI